jgi:hypothetical protein
MSGGWLVPRTRPLYAMHATGPGTFDPRLCPAKPTRTLQLSVQTVKIAPGVSEDVGFSIVGW